MTPRERVLTALSFRPPDRTPCDFWAEECTWKRLLAHVGHEDKERLLDELGVDVRHLEVRDPPERALGGGVFQNFWGERYVYRPDPLGTDARGRPRGPGRGQDARRPGGLRLADAGRVRLLRRWPSNAAGWTNTPCSTALPTFGSGPRWCAAGRGCSSTWSSGPTGSTSSAASSPISIGRTTRGRPRRPAGGSTCSCLISDLGSQSGPLISLAMFRQFVAPYLKEMVDCIHGLGAKVLYHSCGRIRPFIPELIALGVDILDPIQPAGPEMAPERLAADFAGQICFHGGIDMQRLLPHGTPEQIRAEVRRYCRDARPPAAATSSAPPISSSPTSRRKTSWRCTRRSVETIAGCGQGGDGGSSRNV